MTVFFMIIQKNYNRFTSSFYCLPLLSILSVGGLTDGFLATPVVAQELLAQSQVVQRAEKQYVVYVNSDSSLLLEVVQQVQPGATLREYQQRVVIEVGTYFRKGEAEVLVKRLEQRGIKAEVADPEERNEFQRSIVAVPTVVPLPSRENQPVTTDVPSILVFPQATLGLYQVVVSVNDALPQEVRRVASEALEKVYEGRLMIHAASFVNLRNAENLKAELALRGIPSNIVQTLEEMAVWTALQPIVPAVAAVPSNPSGPGHGLATQDSYFVLIPGQSNNLTVIQNDLVTLGAPQSSITVQNTFIAVGPFASRGLAEEWETYFLGAGLSGAQVYFGK
ncbi:MAG: hypothetical protein ACRC8A_21045 [Microcoleaceae cyanobacterium]